MNSCGKTDFHAEHYYENTHGNDAWCWGNYEVVETFGPWRIVLDPDDKTKGYIDTDQNIGLPPYYIESHRLHEGEPNGYTLRDHMDDKIWAKPYLADFAAALSAAQARWPRK